MKPPAESMAIFNGASHDQLSTPCDETILSLLAIAMRGMCQRRESSQSPHRICAHAQRQCALLHPKQAVLQNSDFLSKSALTFSCRRRTLTCDVCVYISLQPFMSLHFPMFRPLSRCNLHNLM